MDFRLTDDQRTLQRGVREYLDGEHGPEVLRRLDGLGGRDPGVHDGLVGMGLAALLVPEAQDGLGLGLVEGVLVGMECGYADVSDPLVETALIAAPLLVGETDALSAIGAGELTVALSHPVNPWIADLDSAGQVLGVPPDGEPRRLESADPLRRLFTGAGSGGQGDDRMLDLAALMSAAQLLGGAERMLKLAADYATAREQFGQPIGAFQAVKHQLANVSVKIEFARPVLLRAAYAAEHRHARTPVQVSHAKLAATDAAMLAAETAIQVHGAMGYTYEVDLHYWMKRAWALAGAWGDRAFHERRLADAVIGGRMALGPDQTFESELARA